MRFVFVALIAASSCVDPAPAAPAVEDIEARLGGLDEAVVVGVSKGDGHYVVTGRCLEAKGAGFSVRVDVTPTLAVEGVVGRAEHHIKMACLDRVNERLDEETARLQRELERLKQQ